MWLFYHFNFERSYDVLKSKSPCILLNKNVNFNKNETKSKMEDRTHSFREMNLMLKQYSVLNTLSEYTYIYISKNITSYTSLLVFKIVQNI